MGNTNWPQFHWLPNSVEDNEKGRSQKTGGLKKLCGVKYGERGPARHRAQTGWRHDKNVVNGA